MLVNYYRRKDIFLLSTKPLYVTGQTNSGSLMLLFDFCCKCDKPTNRHRTKIIYLYLKWPSWLHGCAVLLLLRLNYEPNSHYYTSWMFSRDRNREKTSFTTTSGSYLMTVLESAQVFFPSFLWLKHVACCCAAADPPRKRPTVQQCPGHLLTPSAPISISGLAERPIRSQCRPVPVNCVHGSSPEASREGHRSTETSVWESVSTGRHKHHHTY